MPPASVNRPRRQRRASSCAFVFLVALGVLAVLPTLAQAQPAEVDFAAEWPLDEPDLVSVAARQNPSLASSVRSVAIARERLAGESTYSPWVFGASATYSHSDSPVRDALSRGLQIRDTFDFGVSLAKSWSFGLELLVRFDNTIARSETPLSFTAGGVDVVDRRITGPYDVSVLSVRLTQHLLRGRDMDVNLMAERIAEREVTVARLALEERTSETVLDVLDTYWDLARAQRDVALRRRSIERLARQREITQDLIDAGRIAPIELDVIEQQEVAAEEAVLLAELSRDQAELGVRRAAGLELDAGGRRLVATAPESVPPLPAGSIEGLIEHAQQRSYQVRTLEEQLARVDLQIEQASAALDPTLDVFVQISQQGIDDDIGIDDALFFDAWKQVFGLEYGAVSAGVIFSIPFDDTRTESALEVARLERERLMEELTSARRQVESNVRAQYAALERTRERLGLLERSVSLAERNLELGQDRFAEKQLTTLELLRLQEALEDAEARLASARIELIEQTLRVEHAVGSLLDRLGVMVIDEDAP